MKRELVIVIAAALGLSACGGGGGGSTASSGTTNSDGEVLSSLSTGYSLPSEISAVPTDNSSTAASLSRGLGSSLRALARAVAVSSLPADSDYNKAQTRKFVEERELEQFDIIETVMNAVAQTHYDDAANINNGPYKVMIAWEDENNGVSVKQLQPWVVDSRMIVVNGQDVNRLLAWIEEVDPATGQPSLIKAEFKIYQSPTVNADGSYADYGEWDLNVKFNANDAATASDTTSNFFAATARIVNGQTILKINNSETRDEQGTTMTFNNKAVMYRSGTAGYGKVAYTDMDCTTNGCTPVDKEAAYAYNADYLGVQVGTDPVVYKDRNGKTEFTRRYGLFYANEDTANGITAGDDIEKHNAFGFPLRYTDSNNLTQHAYYGAWQGRHQLWGGGPNGGGLAAGVTVTREDRGPNQTAESYVTSAPFQGTLTKRTLAAASLSDILNIPVETFINKHFDLNYDGTAGAWKYCDGFLDYSTNPPTCSDPGTNSPKDMSRFTDFGSLQVASGDRKNVRIGRWDPSANNGSGGEINYVYLTTADGATSDGFYEASEDMQTHQFTAISPLALYTPADGDSMYVDIGGSIYISYTGEFSGQTTTTGWVQKTLQSFDEQTWTPTFASGGDTPFTPEMGRDYYINNQGANFVVKRTGTADAASSYEVNIELQTAANPVNFSSILPTGTSYLRTPWRPEVRFTLDTDPSSSNFLKLVYANDDPSTTNVDESATPTVYTSGEWGLQAYTDNGTPSDFTDDAPLMADGTAVTVDGFGIPTDPSMRPVEFNWEYSADGGWGTQQFLCAPDCSAAANYVILSDPIQLQPLTVTNGAGASKTLSLQFDGWMHGLPDLYNELSKNNWQMSPTIADKVINIPAGTLVTGADSTEYYVKPLEVSVFLNEVTDTQITAAGGTVPDLASAASVDLSTGLPTYVTPDPAMGDLPTKADGSDLDVKYSEGKLVE